MATSQREVTVHYVAELQIRKVERTTDPHVSEGKRERTIDDVTKIVLKAGELDKLKKKLTGHIDLIEED